MSIIKTFPFFLIIGKPTHSRYILRTATDLNDLPGHVHHAASLASQKPSKPACRRHRFDTRHVEIHAPSLAILFLLGLQLPFLLVILDPYLSFFLKLDNVLFCVSTVSVFCLTVRHILVECNHFARERKDIFGTRDVVESFR